MNTINKKGMVPRFPGHPGLATRSGSFLDGTLRTYFAPGQDWRTVIQYQKPTDWPHEVALRVPQVVWIYVFHGGGGTFEPVTFPRHVSRLAEARACKTRIEAARPGRTFVSVLDLDGPLIPARSDASQARYADFNVVPPNVGYDSEFFLWVEPPAAGLPEPPPFFPTDFLAILVGLYPVALVDPTINGGQPTHWPEGSNSFHALLHPEIFAFDDQAYILARRAEYLAGATWIKTAFTRIAYRHYGYTDQEDSRSAVPAADYNTFINIQQVQPSTMPYAAELLGLDCQYLGADDLATESALSQLIAAHHGFTLG